MKTGLRYLSVHDAVFSIHGCKMLALWNTLAYSHTKLVYLPHALLPVTAVIFSALKNEWCI